MAEYSSQKSTKKRRLSQVLQYSIFISSIHRLFIATLFLFRFSASAELYFENAWSALNCARTYSKEYDLQEEYLLENMKLAKKSIGAFLPSFEFSWSESDNVPIGSEDIRSKSIGVGVTQKLFNGGKSAIEYKMQITQSKLNFYEFKRNYESFEGEVLRSYYANLLAIAKCRVQEESLQNAQTVLDLAEIQLEQGMITTSEYLATMLSVGKMELQLKAYTDAVAAAQRELIGLLGCSSKEKLIFSEEEILPQEIQIPAPAPLPMEEKLPFVQNAIDNSIDLKKLNLEIDWAKKQHTLQKMVFMPSVSVSGGIEFSGKHYPLTTPSYTLKVIVGFENNPWLPTNVSGASGFKEGRMNSMNSSVSGQGIVNTTYFSQMRMAKINLSQKRLSREKAITQIENSVLELLENIEQNTENLFLNFEMLNLSDKKVELQKLQLEEGMITKKDYLDSLTENTEQKIQVLELRNQQSYLQTQLEILTGRKTGGYE